MNSWGMQQHSVTHTHIHTHIHIHTHTHTTAVNTHTHTYSVCQTHTHTQTASDIQMAASVIDTPYQSWALAVFFKFFNHGIRIFLAFFIKLI